MVNVDDEVEGAVLDERPNEVLGGKVEDGGERRERQ